MLVIKNIYVMNLKHRGSDMRYFLYNTFCLLIFFYGMNLVILSIIYYGNTKKVYVAVQI